jgi:hypothetical protein
MKDLSMHILDIVQNSLNAKADLIEIEINENLNYENTFIIRIRDNGSGISGENLDKVNDPFFTTGEKKTGLGLSLLEQNARMTGGYLNIESGNGTGTSITACFGYDHIDRQPLGDIAMTITGLIRANPKIDFVYIHVVNDKKFKIDTRQVKLEIGDIRINNSRIITFLQEMIHENLEEIKQATKHKIVKNQQNTENIK